MGKCLRMEHGYSRGWAAVMSRCWGQTVPKLLLFCQNPLNPTFAGVGLMGVDTGTLWGCGCLWEQILGTGPLLPAEHSLSLEQFIISLSLLFLCICWP